MLGVSSTFRIACTESMSSTEGLNTASTVSMSSTEGLSTASTVSMSSKSTASTGVSAVSDLEMLGLHRVSAVQNPEILRVLRALAVAVPSRNTVGTLLSFEYSSNSPRTSYLMLPFSFISFECGASHLISSHNEPCPRPTPQAH